MSPQTQTTAPEPGPPTVLDCGDHVEVRGASAGDVTDGLRLLAAARQLQHEEYLHRRDELITILGAAGVDLIAPEDLRDAHRQAARRARLLATPAYSYETLATLRGDGSVAATRTWVSRRRDGGELFTVTDGPRTIIPAFQLTTSGQPRAAFTPILGVLVEAGVTGWALWEWLAEPCADLNGALPHEQLGSNPSAVLRAARAAADRNAAVGPHPQQA